MTTSTMWTVEEEEDLPDYVDDHCCHKLDVSNDSSSDDDQPSAASAPASFYGIESALFQIIEI